MFIHYNYKKKIFLLKYLNMIFFIPIIFNQFVLYIVFIIRAKRRTASTARGVLPAKRKARLLLTDTSSDEENIRRPFPSCLKTRFVYHTTTKIIYKCWLISVTMEGCCFALFFLVYILYSNRGLKNNAETSFKFSL